MKVRLATWKIKTLFSRESQVNPKPQYQRTSVWPPKKKKLLIDSILRGYDLPKFYLKETPVDPVYDYEVTDGQQRMRAIWEFMNEDVGYALDEAVVDGMNTKGLRYETLGKLKERFDSFEINIALIEEATQAEIRTLFSRLQMGSTLNKVELRHAMSSSIGAAILSVVETHEFFKQSRIPNSRYKHQDYLDHVVTLVNSAGQSDVSAKEIEKMYRELATADSSSISPIIKKVINVLDLMSEINSHSKGMFRNKWAFVDTFCLLFHEFESINELDTNKFAETFLRFESERLEQQRSPEKLLEKKPISESNRDLYNYIMAFKYSGNRQENIAIRSEIFKRKFMKRPIVVLNSN